MLLSSVNRPLLIYLRSVKSRMSVSEVEEDSGILLTGETGGGFADPEAGF